MSRASKPTVAAVVLGVKHVTVGADVNMPAVIALQIEGEHDLQLHMAPEILAALEAMLARASAEQAKHRPIQ